MAAQSSMMEICIKIMEIKDEIESINHVYQVDEQKYIKTDKLLYLSELNNLQKLVKELERNINELEETKNRRMESIHQNVLV